MNSTPVQSRSSASGHHRVRLLFAQSVSAWALVAVLVLAVFVFTGCSVVGFGGSLRSGSAAGTEEAASMTGGVVSHHDAIEDRMRDFWMAFAERNPGVELIVLLGPDHEDRLQAAAAVPTVVPEQAQQLTQQLAELPFVRRGEDDVFVVEHAVGVHTQLIADHVGSVPVLPVLLRGDGKLQDLEALSAVLREYGEGKSVAVIGSVDFSHYQAADLAAVYDSQSWNAITDYDYEQLNSFNHEHMDSDQAVIVLLQSVCPEQDCVFDTIYRGNSFNEGVTDRYNTTSYMHFFVE